MKNGKPTIHIQPVKEKPGFYVAYFASEVLQATFSLHFRDTITGAIALNNFVEMLRIHYQFPTYILQVEDSLPGNNSTVPDVLEIFRDISTRKKKERAFSFPGV